MKILPRANNQRITDELLERFKKVEPATIGHYVNSGFMNPAIKSMLDDVKVTGLAFTVKTAGKDSVMVHKAVSMAEEGDVIVIDRSGDTRHACVGGVVAYAANSRKVSAIIIDGPCTDIQDIRKLGIPVFATGLSPITTNVLGESGEINTTVQCGGVVVESGDLILADDNGVLVIPKDAPYDEMLQRAEASIEREPKTKALLDSGRTLASIGKADELLKELLVK
jgi:4-hydroxy-4-methyl-2-oxoglutarate aldolase